MNRPNEGNADVASFDAFFVATSTFLRHACSNNVQKQYVNITQTISALHTDLNM